MPNGLTKQYAAEGNRTIDDRNGSYIFRGERGSPSERTCDKKYRQKCEQRRQAIEAEKNRRRASAKAKAARREKECLAALAIEAKRKQSEEAVRRREEEEVARRRQEKEAARRREAEEATARERRRALREVDDIKAAAQSDSKRTMDIARRVAAEIVQASKKNAEMLATKTEKIIAEAHAEAGKIIAGARAEAAKITAEAEQIKSQANNVLWWRLTSIDTPLCGMDHRGMIVTAADVSTGGFVGKELAWAVQRFY